MNRGKILIKQVSSSFIFKILAMGMGYISIPLFLKFLGKQDYGLWMTIFSIINWIYTFDLGIGNGLRTKLSESIARKDYSSSKEYITTGYIVLSTIAISILFLGIILIKFNNLTKFLNIDFYTEGYIKLVFISVFTITIINFIIFLYKIFYLSVHNSFVGELNNFIFQISFILILYLLNYFGKINLISIAIIYPGINMIIGILSTVNFFKKYPNLKPGLKYFKKEKIKEINGLGILFFIIQVCTLIIYTTDNMLIIKYIGAEEVTTYNIVSKLFQVLIILEYLISSPMWTLFVDAYVKKDKGWVKKAFINLNLLFLLLILGVAIMSYILPFIVKLWIGQELIYPKHLILFWGLFVLNRVYGDIYMIFINATGKIKLQMYLSVLGAIINIPLTIYFMKNLNMGSSGAILATNICILPLTIIMPIQAYYILKKM